MACAVRLYVDTTVSCVAFEPVDCMYRETSVIRHSMGLERSVGLGGCRITEYLLSCSSMWTAPHQVVRLHLRRFRCTY